MGLWTNGSQLSIDKASESFSQESCVECVITALVVKSGWPYDIQFLNFITLQI